MNGKSIRLIGSNLLWWYFNKGRRKEFTCYFESNRCLSLIPATRRWIPLLLYLFSVNYSNTLYLHRTPLLPRKKTQFHSSPTLSFLKFYWKRKLTSFFLARKLYCESVNAYVCTHARFEKLLGESRVRYLVVEIVAFARRSRRASHALALIALLILH